MLTYALSSNAMKLASGCANVIAIQRALVGGKEERAARGLHDAALRYAAHGV